jgi:hypothetical protein
LSGEQQWVRQFGPELEYFPTGIEGDDAGNLYLSGHTGNGFDEGDSFLMKYDSSGNQQWVESFGVFRGDWATDVSVDANGVYVAGFTPRVPGQPFSDPADAYVKKFDSEGHQIWSRQIGTGLAASSYATNVHLSQTGSLYLAGHTKSALPGQQHAGVDDAWVAKLAGPLYGDYDRNGVVGSEDLQDWQASFGSASNLLADGDEDGDVDGHDFLIWQSNFGLMAATTNAAAVPEPVAWILCIVGLPSLLRRGLRHD